VEAPFNLIDIVFKSSSLCTLNIHCLLHPSIVSGILLGVAETAHVLVPFYPCPPSTLWWKQLHNRGCSWYVKLFIGDPLPRF
jgi:hypothetical protein